MAAELLEKPRHKEIDQLDTGMVEPQLLLIDSDKRCLTHFDQIKQWSARLSTQLNDIEQKLLASNPADSEQIQAIRAIRHDAEAITQGALPKLFSYTIEKLTEIYKLRERQEGYVQNLAETHSRLEDALEQLKIANQQLGQLANSLGYRARIFVSKLNRLLKTPGRIPAVVRWRIATMFNKYFRSGTGTPTSSAAPTSAPIPAGASPGNQDTRKAKDVKSFSQEHGFHQLQNPYGDVDNGETAMSIFDNWVTVFSRDGRRYGSREPLVSDDLPTITELHQHFPLTGKHVLELGPLEGGNTKQMVDFGAASVTGIESAQESFVKCLLLKNTLQLDNVDFIFGNCIDKMAEQPIGRRSSFDICVASGLLYHMENPVQCIDRISKISDVAYIWSHVASERSPLGSWITITDDEGRSYRGRQNQYKPTDVLGGIGYVAVWLTPEAMKQAFIDRGFEIQDIGEVNNYKGDAVKFIARRVR